VTDPGAGGEAELRAEIEDLRARLARAEAELEDRKQFVAQVMGAEDRARRRIAQLIHDDALQSLLAANQELQEAAPGRIGVTRAHEVVSATIQHLREAMISLHPVTLERGGLEQALGAIARQAERQGGFVVSTEVSPQALERNDELVLAVARELLSNAARHSGAERVSLAVLPGEEAGTVVVEVTDDGRGFEPGRPREALLEGHIGLASVAQRAEAHGGEFELLSEPGGGTRARALLRG
jgi:two-component system, NarL family, sensor kinase